MKILTRGLGVILAAVCLGQVSFAQDGAGKMPFARNEKVGEPRLFEAGLISTGDYETEPIFAPDGKTFFFVKSTPDFNFWTIAFSRYEKGRWTTPEIAPFSGQYSDADPFVADDGRRLFFVSRRPVDPRVSPNLEGRLDIYATEKTAAGWSAPQNLGPPVNSEASEYFPTFAKSGTLYFGSGRPGGRGGVDLWRARFADGKFQTPENLGDAVNTAADEFEPFIAPDESFLIFMAANRPDGLGGFDLYISYNENGVWTKAQNLGAPVNSPGDELGAKATPDGRYLFWSSTRSRIDRPKSKPQTFAELTNDYRGPQNGLGDIYYIDLGAVMKKR
ncbi:MAG: PD40 domain-containing protein [Acidobacteria bacterium]|nr:PD40 domain-containing protein [Acidobacteriota bacterium]